MCAISPKVCRLSLHVVTDFWLTFHSNYQTIQIKTQNKKNKPFQIGLKVPPVGQQWLSLWGVSLETRGWLAKVQHGPVSTECGLVAGEVPVHGVKPVTARGTWLCDRPLKFLHTIMHGYKLVVNVIFMPVCKIGVKKFILLKGNETFQIGILQ